MAKTITTRYDVAEHLRTPEEMAAYLEACIDPEKCWGCGVCSIKCKPQAIIMREVRPPEYIPA